MNRPGTLPGLGRDGLGGDRLGGDGLGGNRPSQLPAGDRRDGLRDRLNGDGIRDDGIRGDGIRDNGIRDRERPSQRPERNWDERRQDWQDHRDEVRNDWQDHRDDVRNDWQDWYDDNYPWHGGWYWGAGAGYWGSWDYLWDDYPVAAAAGLTWWGVNAMSSTFGVGADYYNPYYSDTTVINYSEPIVSTPVYITSEAEVAAPAQAAAPAQTSAPMQVPTPPQADLDKFDQARVAFAEDRFDEALQLVDEAALKMPHDATVHEFRSLVLFALKRYSESAAAIHAVLAVGPGWDWKTLSGLYSGVDTYTAQLRALEDYCKTNPKAADAQFLLGYHYLTTGSSDAALSQFRRVSELQPKDSVSASLVRSLSPRDEATKPAPATQVGQPESKPVSADAVVGTWTATGRGTSKYSVALDKEGTFTWNYSRGERKQEVKGVYTIEGNVLAMETDAGGTMLAELTAKAPGNLHFQMIGGGKDDPGLDFKKSN